MQSIERTDRTMADSRWMDYDSILDFWSYYTNGLVITDEIHGEEVELQDFYDTWKYPDKKTAALECLETIKVWAEDDDEAMEFIIEITQGEITAEQIRG